MKKSKLSAEEKSLEKALIKGEYAEAPDAELREIAEAIARRRKKAVLHVRVNRQDLDSIKRKAERLGVKYQTLVSELLHRFAA
jgi:predicted DNA binding CopG/RHH family protein